MTQNRYSLPELSFISGESQNLVFRLFTEQNQPVDAGDITCSLSAIPYGNINAVPVLTKSGVIVNAGGNEKAYIKVLLEPNDTISLSGKYIYQISLKDYLDNIELYQGILTIFHNVDKNFISNK